MLSHDSFSQKRILVTGASSGIGREAAKLLSTLGASVILIGRDENKLNDALNELAPGKHAAIAFDLCNFDDYQTLFDRIADTGEKLDGMVHCAGVAPAIPVKAISTKAIDSVFSINFFAYMMLIKYFAKKKYSNEGSHLASLSAINVHYPSKCMSVYAASKGALEAASRSLAIELYDSRRFVINTLVVGPVVTPMSGYAQGDYSEAHKNSEIAPNLMGMAAPNEIANMIAFLLCEDCCYSTGREFYVDGGRL